MSEPVVLLAHQDPKTLEELRFNLSQRGYHVLPTRRAGIALAIASQVPPAFAIVGEQLAGRRSGRVLADALRSNWGVPSLLLKDVQGR